MPSFARPAGRNWAGNLQYGARELHEPTTVEQVQEIVSRSERVRALGSRHSFNDIADTHGDLISVSRLTGAPEIDEDRRTVTIPGGLRYGDLAEPLERAGWALDNMASLPHISVAGAIATATHGSGDDNPTLSSAVAAVELVTGDGSLLQVDRAHDDFAGIVVGVGALGIITRLSLDIVPTFSLRQDFYLGATLDRIIEDFDEITAAGYSVSINPDWTPSGRGRIRVKSRSADAPDTLGGAARTVVADSAPGVTDATGEHGPWFDRLPHFRLAFTPSFGEELQSEYLVRREVAGEALDALRSLAPQFLPAVHGVEVRTMRADELWLSPAYGQDAVGIHFTWRLEPERVESLLPAIEGALAPFSPRPHWGKIFGELRGDYPRMPDFLALRDRLDPRRVFANAFSDRVLGA